MVPALAFSRDGKMVATAAAERTVRLSMLGTITDAMGWRTSTPSRWQRDGSAAFAINNDHLPRFIRNYNPIDRELNDLRGCAGRRRPARSCSRTCATMFELTQEGLDGLGCPGFAARRAKRRRDESAGGATGLPAELTGTHSMTARVAPRRSWPMTSMRGAFLIMPFGKKAPDGAKIDFNVVDEKLYFGVPLDAAPCRCRHRPEFAFGRNLSSLT